MPGNTFGRLFRITTFGESHGPAIGVIIDGCPAGLYIDKNLIQKDLDRRKPGQSQITTQRKEPDDFEILSGIFEGKSTGTPIALLIRNKDYKSRDYSHISNKFRPSHADFTYQEKYGIRDHRGGGRSSARETATRVAAGAIAKQLLSSAGVHISAFVSQIGDITLEKSLDEIDLSQTENNMVRCPDELIAGKMIDLIKSVRKEGDSLGGKITCVVKNCPVGLGDPVFHKLHADLSWAVMGINAVKGFEIGSGFRAVTMRGSEHNDIFYKEGDKILTKSNFSGGIQGGISNGMDIYFNAAFKPVATIMKDQSSVDTKGKETMVKGKGRHDPCVVPRAVPIVEAMAALVLADHWLLNRASRI